MSEIKEAVRTKSNGAETKGKESTGLANRDERRADRLAKRASTLGTGSA